MKQQLVQARNKGRGIIQLSTLSQVGLIEDDTCQVSKAVFVRLLVQDGNQGMAGVDLKNRFALGYFLTGSFTLDRLDP